MSGKGSKPRPTDLPTFRENHDRIFGKNHLAPAVPEYRSDCCGAETAKRDGVDACQQCLLFCVPNA